VARRNARYRLRQVDAQLASLDAAIARTIDSDPVLARRRDILVSIPGVSAITAAALLADMPELGSINERQVASLAGLAPVARQSGKWQGKSFIRGGRSNLRQALYMPALVATRFNPDLKRSYEALIQRGKPAKLAITAIMRRLLVLANALIRTNRTWAIRAA
jgi:transposase